MGALGSNILVRERGDYYSTEANALFTPRIPLAVLRLPLPKLAFPQKLRHTRRALLAHYVGIIQILPLARRFLDKLLKSFNSKFLAPTYSCPEATIGANWLNGSVRNGKRCFPVARGTRNSGLKRYKNVREQNSEWSP